MESGGESTKLFKLGDIVVTTHEQSGYCPTEVPHTLGVGKVLQLVESGEYCWIARKFPLGSSHVFIHENWIDLVWRPSAPDAL